MPAWTDCATRRSHPARSHPSDGSMRLRVPIRHDERIGHIAADEALPSVILPGSVPLEMRSDTYSIAPFTGHRVLLGGSEHVCAAASFLAHDAWAFLLQSWTRRRPGNVLFQGRFPVILFIGCLLYTSP